MKLTRKYEIGDNYDWDLDIIPASDILNYVQAAHLSDTTYFDMHKDMLAVTASIATALASRISGALKGASSDTSTPSKSDISKTSNHSLQDIEEIEDKGKSSVENSEDEDTFDTRKSAREKHKVNRYEGNQTPKKKR